MKNLSLLAIALVACTTEQDLGNRPTTGTPQEDASGPSMDPLPGTAEAGTSQEGGKFDGGTKTDAGSQDGSTATSDSGSVGPDSGSGIPTFQVVRPASGTLAWNTIYASSSSNIMFGGSGGAIARWNGSVLAADPAITSSSILLLTGSGANDVWATTRDNGVYHYNGAAWTGLRYTAAAAIDATNAMAWFGVNNQLPGSRYIVDLDRSVLLNSSQAEVSTPKGLPAVGGYAGATIAAFSTTDVWISSKQGSFHSLEHWNGTSWSEYKPLSPAELDIQTLHGRSPSDMWAVGFNASSGNKCGVAHWDGLAWTPVCTGIPTVELGNMIGVFAESATRVWAVGYNGVSFYDGVAWQKVTLPAGVTQPMRAVSVVGSQVWIAGSSGIILRSQ
jgi:hypothetical protein